MKTGNKQLAKKVYLSIYCPTSGSFPFTASPKVPFSARVNIGPDVAPLSVETLITDNQKFDLFPTMLPLHYLRQSLSLLSMSPS